MGSREVPSDALYGATTQRAVLNFPVSGYRLSRPLIRQPMLVKMLKEKKTTQATCVSCNKCLLAIFLDLHLKCYKDLDMKNELEKKRLATAA